MILYVGHYIFSKAKRQGNIKRVVPTVHQTSVINKHRLNVIGVKGYGCTIKVVILGDVLTLLALPRGKSLFQLLKTSLCDWRERLLLLYLLYLGATEMLDQNTVSHLLLSSC